MSIRFSAPVLFGGDESVFTDVSGGNEPQTVMAGDSRDEPRVLRRSACLLLSLGLMDGSFC